MRYPYTTYINCLIDSLCEYVKSLKEEKEIKKKLIEEMQVWEDNCDGEDDEYSGLRESGKYIQIEESYMKWSESQ